MDRQARIVRFWFLLAAVSVVGLWHPAVWFAVLPMFFFPTCTCCGLTCETCDPAYLDRFQVDISGMADGNGTGCNAWDGTFYLDLVSISALTCIWCTDPDLDIDCGTAAGFDFELLRVIIIPPTFPATDYIGYVRVTTCWTGGCAGTPSLGNIIYSYNFGTSKPDCSGFSALSFTYDSQQQCTGFLPACCDGSGATVNVTAIA